MLCCGGSTTCAITTIMGCSSLQLSHEFDRSYLAWETVRLSRNPFFSNGTGTEGYWVGLCQSSRPLDQLLQLGNGAQSQARLFRYRGATAAGCARALQGEGSDLETMAEWSIELGAILGRLRCNLYKNPRPVLPPRNLPPGRGCRPLPPTTRAGRLAANAESARRRQPGAAAASTDPNHLRTTDQEAWDVVASLGKFGHPLVADFEQSAAQLPSGGRDAANSPGRPAPNPATRWPRRAVVVAPCVTQQRRPAGRCAGADPRCPPPPASRNIDPRRTWRRRHCPGSCQFADDQLEHTNLACQRVEHCASMSSLQLRVEDGDVVRLAQPVQPADALLGAWGFIGRGRS